MNLEKKKLINSSVSTKKEYTSFTFPLATHVPGHLEQYSEHSLTIKKLKAL